MNKSLNKEIYLKHEEVYKSLKEEGFDGWGCDKNGGRIKSWQSSVNKLLDYLNDSRGKLLDLGCGNGDLSMLFYDLGFEVTGIEISETAVEWAKEKALKANKNIEFLCRDICEIDAFPSDKFDIIWDGNCLHCILGNDRSVLLKNIYDSLKHQGVFFVSSIIKSKHIVGDDDQIKLDKRISPVERCLITKDELEEELTKSGFKIEKCWIFERTANDHYCGILIKV